MCLTEYDEEEVKELFKEEGREEGARNSTVEHIKEIMQKLKYTIEQAMDLLNIPGDERADYRKIILQ